MNETLHEGVQLAKDINDLLKADKPNCDVVICTPFIHLTSVARVLDKEIVGLGAENCADKEKGCLHGRGVSRHGEEHGRRLRHPWATLSVVSTTTRRLRS